MTLTFICIHLLKKKNSISFFSVPKSCLIPVEQVKKEILHTHIYACVDTYMQVNIHPFDFEHIYNYQHGKSNRISAIELFKVY